MSSTIELMTILYQGRAGEGLEGGEGDWLTREYKEGKENLRHDGVGKAGIRWSLEQQDNKIPPQMTN